MRQLAKRNNFIIRRLHDDKLKILFDFPSYAIKCLVFLHDHCCENDTNRVSDCILQVLGQLLKRFQTDIDYVSKCLCIHGNKLLICVEKVFGDSLEVVDDFEVATEIANEVSDIINTLRSVTETTHENSEPPTLSSRMVGPVENVLKKNKVPLLSKYIYFFFCCYFLFNRVWNCS